MVGTREGARRPASRPGQAADIEGRRPGRRTCICFRKQMTEARASLSVARGGAPFYHVVTDGEYRIPPPDVDGRGYAKTYIYVAPGALLFEPLRDLQHAKARRAFVRGATQATTWPLLPNSGRGQEVYYAPMKGRWAPLGGAGRSNPARRPCGPADAERAPIKYAGETGIHLREVFRCAPLRWGELLPLREFLTWNPPGMAALAPRELVPSWSPAPPLEREPRPRRPVDGEAAADGAAAESAHSGQPRDRCLQRRARAGWRLAARAIQAAAEHAPRRRPWRAPFEGQAAKCNTATLWGPETLQGLGGRSGGLPLGVPDRADDGTERVIGLEADDGRGRAPVGQLLAALAGDLSKYEEVKSKLIKLFPDDVIDRDSRPDSRQPATKKFTVPTFPARKLQASKFQDRFTANDAEADVDK
mgnify:CR=1 FL=1